jgi:hypothetical protein
MEQSSNKCIFQIDYTVCNLLVREAQEARAQAPDKAAQEPSRPPLMFLVDPFTGMIMACWLSYEEKQEAESEHRP